MRRPANRDRTYALGFGAIILAVTSALVFAGISEEDPDLTDCRRLAMLSALAAAAAGLARTVTRALKGRVVRWLLLAAATGSFTTLFVALLLASERATLLSGAFATAGVWEFI